MTILATVENDTIRLPFGVHLHDGLQVRVETLSTNSDDSISKSWPTDYFTRTAGALVNEPFVRPEQTPVEIREAW